MNLENTERINTHMDVSLLIEYLEPNEYFVIKRFQISISIII